MQGSSAPNETAAAASQPTETPTAVRRRLGERLAAGRPPTGNELPTLWEAYRAAVLLAGPTATARLPDDVVAELRADHDALVRLAADPSPPPLGVPCPQAGSGIGQAAPGRGGRHRRPPAPP